MLARGEYRIANQKITGSCGRTRNYVLALEILKFSFDLVIDLHGVANG